MKFGFAKTALHKGKILFTAKDINHSFENQILWRENLNVQIKSGDRIVIKGSNGSGKTTLIKMIIGVLKPKTGTVYNTDSKTIYIDQDYSLIENQLTVFDQIQRFNDSSLEEHTLKMKLNKFLFSQNDWAKPCSALSGGEKMRLLLCCLTINTKAPDIIILDEPTNNLDIQNIEILTAAINEYEGTLIVVSHDDLFLEEIKIFDFISLQ